MVNFLEFHYFSLTGDGGRETRDSECYKEIESTCDWTRSEFFRRIPCPRKLSLNRKLNWTTSFHVAPASSRCPAFLSQIHQMENNCSRRIEESSSKLLLNRIADVRHSMMSSDHIFEKVLTVIIYHYRRCIITLRILMLN